LKFLSLDRLCGNRGVEGDRDEVTAITGFSDGQRKVHLLGELGLSRIDLRRYGETVGQTIIRHVPMWARVLHKEISQ